MNKRLDEVLRFSAPASWVPMAEFDQVAAVANATEGNATVTLRKATNAAGDNAADVKDAVIAAGQAVVAARAHELGEHASGPFTHVSATVAGTGATGLVIRGHAGNNP